jgi:arylsulfatase A-like enzyme
MNKQNLSRNNFLELLKILPLFYIKSKLEIIPNKKNNDYSQYPNFLIIIFDSLSAKNMSLYGYSRNTTPKLDKIAFNSTVFHNHHSGGNYTSPGTASILTGTYPWLNRAFHFFASVENKITDFNIFKRLPNSYHTFTYTHNPLASTFLNQFKNDIDSFINLDELMYECEIYSNYLFQKDFQKAINAEMLFLDDYAPAPSSLFLSLSEGLRREITRKVKQKKIIENFSKGLPGWLFGPYILESFSLEYAFDWLIKYLSKINEPFLGYLHFLPPHSPYNTRNDFINIFQDNWNPIEKPKYLPEKYSYEDQSLLNTLRREYDEFLSYVDCEFERLYKSLDRMGILDNTYLILTSDHGELFERGIQQHITPALYEPVINIPLIIFEPEQKERKDVYSLTSNVDLLPTILKLSGEPIPDLYEGQVLEPIISGKSMSSDSKFVVEAKENPKFAPLNKATFAILREDYKLVYYKGYDEFEDFYEFYNLRNDPEEMENLAKENHPMLKEMKEELNLKLEEERKQWSKK